MKEQVDILLATYQGDEFLEELLKSIFTQRHQSFHLWIRDDGSTDKTSEILANWSKTFPNNITIIPSTISLGAKGSFCELIRFSQAPYIMFADQDDVWLPFKIEASLDLMHRMERQYDSHIPLLVHSDLRVVDENLKEISPSYWKYTGINPNKSDLNYLLTQNIVTGCSVMINKSLANLALPIPAEAIMHDWWIALVAASFGHIGFLSQPTILYRQHTQNNIGAKRYGLIDFFRKGLFYKKLQRVHGSTALQGKALLTHYQEFFRENPEKQKIVTTFGSLRELTYFKKIFCIFKFHFFKQGLLRNVKSFLTNSF